MISTTDNTLPLIVLEGIEEKNRFYTSNSSKDKEPTKLANGEEAYKVLAYCDTGDEALCIIEADGYDSMERYIEKTEKRFAQMGLGDCSKASAFCRYISAKEAYDRNLKMLMTSPQTIIDAGEVHRV